MTVNIAGFWVMTSCSLVGVYWRFRGTYCLRRVKPSKLRTGGLSLKMDAVHSSETPVNFCQTTRHQDVKVIRLAAVDAAGAVRRRTETGCRKSGPQGHLYARCLCARAINHYIINEVSRPQDYRYFKSVFVLLGLCFFLTYLKLESISC